MKNLGFIAVMALLMMFGCVKDEVITDEQELFSVEKNSQPVIYGEKGPTKDNAGVGTGIWFKGTSSLLDDSTSENLPLTIIYDDDTPKMQILSHGNFSGRLLMGYGTIDEIRSYYDITISEPIKDVNYYVGRDWRGQYTYNITIEGIVHITDRASSYFTFILRGEFHTSYNTINQFYQGSANELTGVMTYVDDKFLSWKDKPLKSRVGCNDLTTGIINLNVN